MELEKNPFAVLLESKEETSFFGLLSTPMYCAVYIVHLMIAGKFIKKSNENAEQRFLTIACFRKESVQFLCIRFFWFREAII